MEEGLVNRIKRIKATLDKGGPHMVAFFSSFNEEERDFILDTFDGEGYSIKDEVFFMFSDIKYDLYVRGVQNA